MSLTKPMEIQKDISSLGGCYGAGTDGEDPAVLLIGQFFHIMQSNPGIWLWVRWSPQNQDELGKLG